jgi:hypothetical protein
MTPTQYIRLRKQLGDGMMSNKRKVLAIVREALAEDKREGGHFDVTGFYQFCPEDREQDIAAAWHMYNAIKDKESGR